MHPILHFVIIECSLDAKSTRIQKMEATDKPETIFLLVLHPFIDEQDNIYEQFPEAKG